MRKSSTVTTYKHDLETWDEIKEVTVEKNYWKKEMNIIITYLHGNTWASFVRPNIISHLERTIPRGWTYSLEYKNWD